MTELINLYYLLKYSNSHYYDDLFNAIISYISNKDKFIKKGRRKVAAANKLRDDLNKIF